MSYYPLGGRRGHLLKNMVLKRLILKNMFKPENDKLKTIVFHLLKKKPTYYYTQFPSQTVIVWRINNDECISLRLPFCFNDLWAVNLHISTTEGMQEYKLETTEREAMEIKWAVDDFIDELKQDGLDKVANFALEEKGTMDELIED